MSKSDAGKGDTYRPVDKKRYDENYEAVYSRKCSKCEKVKPLRDFYFFKSKGVYDTRCKKCSRKQALDRYHSKEGQAYAKKRLKSGDSKKARDKWEARNGKRFRFLQKLKKYNLTEKSYAKLLCSQDNSCAICTANLESLNSRQVHIDHNHSTGRVRGILCNKCNQGLGLFNESILLFKKAVYYMGQESNWFCTKLIESDEHCRFCKYNKEATEIQTRFFCPVTGVEPNRKDCTDD